MKKFIYTAVAALAGMLAVSCVQENELVKFDPSATVAQTLGDIQGCALAADGEAITTTFKKADFGLQAPAAYTLFAALPGTDFNPMEKVNASINGENITISQKDLNNLILNLGGEADADFALEFKLAGFLTNDKGAEIAGSRVYSNKVSAVFVPYSATRLDVDIYDHVWVIGASSTIGAWAHDKVYQYLYNYNKDGKTYTGLIDFGEDGASGGWKLTGIAGWQDDCNWGSEAQAEAAEQSEIQLITGGGSKDIKCLSKRFYSLKFDTSSLVLNVLAGFNNIGIVGSFNGWNAADAECKMAYNDAYHRFYIDYTFADDAELKFTADDSWDLNWGVDCKNGGDNIKVSKGSYRIYFDLNAGEYSFNDKMFGKDEPGREVAPEPPFEGWSLIGTIGETNWDTDFDMTEKGEGVFFYNGIELTENSEFKIRKGHDWGVSYGAAAEVKIGEAFAATTDNGGNIKVGVAGKFDITLDTAANTILIAEHQENSWSVIGVNGDWENDVDMKEVAPGIWVSEKINVASGDWKIRMGKAWAVNRGAAAPAGIGAFVEAVQDGPNVALTGEFQVVYNANIDALGTLGWGLVGSIASIGFGWNEDLPMNLGTDGKWYSSPVKLVETDEFKLRYMGGWDVNVGGTYEAADQAFAAEDGGANIKGVKEGTYYVIYDPAAKTITLSQAFWGIIGDFNSWGGDIFMMNAGEGKWVAYNVALTGGWKIRQGAGWDVNRGGTYTAGAAFAAVPGGDNINAGEGSFDIIYDSVAETIEVK